MKKAALILMLIFGFSLVTNAKNTEVYPTNWWVGMKTNSIQLLSRSFLSIFNISQSYNKWCDVSKFILQYLQYRSNLFGKMSFKNVLKGPVFVRHHIVYLCLL